jgi:CubicO group peptidase (beta-lactamase class C family)
MLVAPGGSYDTILEPANSQITLKHLISHTSGLTYWTSVTGVGDVAEQYDELGVMTCAAEDRKSLADETRLLAQLPLISQPGESWNYSLSIDVLGAVIEQVTGKRLGTYLDEVIFKPLSMNDTFFAVPEDKRLNVSRIYTTASPAQLASIEPSKDIDWKILPSAQFSNYGLSERPCDSGGGGLMGSVKRLCQVPCNDRQWW